MGATAPHSYTLPSPSGSDCTKQEERVSGTLLLELEGWEENECRQIWGPPRTDSFKSCCHSTHGSAFISML